jgi:CheY-like chemotaxis protein
MVLADALRWLGDGYEIVAAHNGMEALAEAQQQAFDLLITDLKMSELGGTELTRSVKELSPDTAVIWITAYGCHNVSTAAEELDVHCCLDKPLEIGAIRRAARDALQMLADRRDGKEGGQET